jgi:hypothetical protein
MTYTDISCVEGEHRPDPGHQRAPERYRFADVDRLIDMPELRLLRCQYVGVRRVPGQAYVSTRVNNGWCKGEW